MTKPLIIDNPQDPFEVIDTPWGRLEAWRASAMATGTMGALAQVAAIVRNDAAEAVARAEETEARKALVQHLCDMVAALQDRVNRLSDALEERQRADAAAEERQREFEEEPIEEPPGMEDDTHVADGHVPGGELHDLPPSEETLSEIPEPSLELEDQAEFPQPGEPPELPIQQPTAITFDKEANRA